MKRRSFMLGAAAMAGAISGAGAITVFPSASRSDLRCTPYDFYGWQHCEAGIPSLRFVQALQQCPQWCWAACIQMAFNTAGRPVHQQTIVERLFPDLRCWPATGQQIISTVNNGQWRDIDGRAFRAEARTLVDMDHGVWSPGATEYAAHELARNNVLIIGALGHATVLTMMGYAVHVSGTWALNEVVVRDPWPGIPNSRRRLGPHEVYNVGFLATVHVV